MSSAAFLPLTSAWNRSGYWVAEWLPQIVMRVMSLTVVPVLAASWADGPVVVEAGHGREALAGRCPGALFMAMRALVLAGLPTTRMRDVVGARCR